MEKVGMLVDTRSGQGFS